MTVARSSKNHIQKTANGLAEVYSDANLHLSIAKILQKHLLDEKDIRELALNRFDFSEVKSIIDLGCGFGFFTRGVERKGSKGC